MTSRMKGSMGARFQHDITIPDGSKVKKGSPIVKVWSLKNIGSTKWSPGARMVVKTHTPCLVPAFSRVARIDGILRRGAGDRSAWIG
eukprot:1249115-Amorphochlora_amoeboformis.AAC.2